MLWPDTAKQTESGELSLGGIAASTLASDFGTPLYVFDEATLRSRAQRIVRAFEERYAQSRVVYGGKAYLSPAIVRVFQGMASASMLSSLSWASQPPDL